MKLAQQQADTIQQRRARITTVLGHAPGKAPPKPKSMAPPTGKTETQIDMLYKYTAPRKIETKRFEITPVPKPRQTQSDRWKKRACVVRYRAFKDEVKALGLDVPETGCRLIFVLPMPKSWSKKKRAQMNGQPHQQRPDTDNMIKAVLDAVHTEDSQIHHVEGVKFWGESGVIIVEKTRQALSFDVQQILWSA